MTDISIILACYNARRFIGNALDSVLAQEGPSLEVLVVDDGSTDDTPSQVAGIAARDRRVRLIAGGHNQGPGFARNLALSEAQGDWIGVLDADDAFAPGRLSHLFALARTSNADIVSDNLQLVEEGSGESLGVMFPPSWINQRRELPALTYVEGNIGQRNVSRRAYGYMKPLVRRAFLEQHRIVYRISRFAEDYILGLDLLLAGARWIVTPEAFYLYSVRSDSLSAACSDEMLEILLAAEQPLSGSPSVKTDPRLRAALHRHSLTVLRALQWNRFMRHLKDRRPVSAARVALSDPAATPYLAGELFALARRKVGRPLREEARSS